MLATLVIGFLCLVLFVVVVGGVEELLDPILVAGIIGVVGTLGAAWLAVYLTRRAHRMR